MAGKILMHLQRHTFKQKFHLQPRKLLILLIRYIQTKVLADNLMEMLYLLKYQKEGATGENRGLSERHLIKYLHHLSPRR
jgi:hypothetical protein